MPKDKKVSKLLVDKDTGEYIEVYEGDKVKITRQEQQDAIAKAYSSKDQNMEVEDWNKELGGFVFVLFKYCDDIVRNHPEITSEDIAKLFYLATYVDYDGYLVLDESYMSRQDINNLLKIHVTNFDIFFNKMKKLNIFIQDNNKNIKINKSYFSKGELDRDIKKYYNYTRIYIKTIRYLFENVPQRKQSQLGNYFKIIPYIHRQQNVLCWNPDSNNGELQLMHVKDLQDILGYHRNSVRGFIKDMLSTRLDNGEAILGFFRTEYDEGKSYIIVNPKVFYGGNFNLEEGKNAVIKWF
jgi:hypothetical protein